MKSLPGPLLISILMLCGLTGCGKKAKENKHQLPKDFVEKTVSTLTEETHKELHTAILTNNVERFKQLLATKSQIDLNIILEDGQTLLTTAVSRDLYPIVEILLENNASVFKTNTRKETPLMLASKLGFEYLVRFLLSSGSKTDTKDLDGNTALHLGILNNHEEIALYLINSRANIDITNNDNQNALKLAEILDMKKVLALLRSLTQSSVGLPTKIDVRNLIALGDVESLNQLFIKYPSITHEYRDLNFYVLIMRSHPHDKALSMTHLLIGFGASLDGPSESEITPLIEAVKNRYQDFVAMMLKENVNPNIVDDKGNTALIWAIRGNSPEMVKMLVDKNSLVKYTYYDNGNRRVMKACDEAKEMKKLSKTSEEKASNEEVLDLLGCSLRWLF